MSDRPPGRACLEMDEMFSRIEKQQAETGKLLAEARKFNRDPWFIMLGAFATVLAARLPEVLNFIASLIHPAHAP